MSAPTSHAAGGESSSSDESSKAAASSKQQLSLPSFSLSQSNPNNVIAGTSKGLGTSASGVIAAGALVVGGPVLGAWLGYNNYGVLGGGVGAVVGTIGGVVGGAVVAVMCVFTGCWQMLIGAIRTPAALVGTASGKDWDDAAQEWVHNDLAEDARRTLPMTDEDFMVALKETGSAAAIFSPHSNSVVASSSSASSAGRARKAVLDRELYDVLGVEPEATVSEIKKAYYVQARKSHPDRNPGDPDAHKKFQKIGEAYQVLSDERLRSAYDTKGKEAVDSSPKMDASAMYAMIFGSENFEPLIGELQISTQLKGMVDGNNPPADLLLFKQRKREVQCAVNLASKLDFYSDAQEAEFLEKVKNEAKDLSESPLGGALLDLIGTCYIDAARAELSYLDSLLINAKHQATGIYEFWSNIVSVTKAAISAIELNGLQQKADAKQKDADDKAGVSPEEREARKKRTQGPLSGGAVGPGPDATPEEKETFRTKTKNVTSHIFTLMWAVTKADVQQTLTNVCTRVMHDHSVAADSRARRAKGLLLVGEEYCRRGVAVSIGLEDFLNRMGTQTGLFGEPGGQFNPDGSPVGGDTSSGGAGHSSGMPVAPHPSLDTEDKVCDCLRDLPSFGIKEIKTRIAWVNGRSDDCLEKLELKRRLKTLLCKYLSVEKLRFFVSSQAEGLVDVSTCDRQMLIDIVVQMG